MKHEHNGLTKVILFGTAVACFVCVCTVVSVFVSKLDTTTLSGVCIAVTAVIAVMPWQLAALLDDRTSSQFALLVKSGMNMSYGALCFTAATILKYGMLRYLETSKEDVLSVGLYLTATLFFTVACSVTSIGFYRFAEHLAHDCHCESNKESGAGNDGANSNNAKHD